MSLSNHLSALLATESVGKEHDVSQTERQEAELLSVAIQAAVDSAEQHAEPLLSVPEGVRWSTSSTLWDDIYASSSSSSSATRNAIVNGAESDATLRLKGFAVEAAGGDEALYESTIARVVECLKDQRSSEEEISILLAETVGFEQLDLVGILVQNRSHVLSDLTAKKSLEHTINNATSIQAQSSNGNASSSAARNLANVDVPTHTFSGSKPYTPGASVVVQTREERDEMKKRRAEQRRQQRARGHLHHQHGNDDDDLDYTEQEMAILRAQSLQAASERPLFSSDRMTTNEPKYPHVFAANAGGNVLSAFGTRFALPAGTQRSDRDYYEEVTIPPPKQLPMRSAERLIPIQEMDTIAQGAFPGYKSLNRLQSVVFPLGYGSNENLLVCAPTGAGKTDVAMLTVLRAIKMHTRPSDTRLSDPSTSDFVVQYNDFKIVYVAPMKALASEIVAKFSKRLRYLGVKVRELTGDMQMTRREIAETQMIVTTPEKWDVVTRKPTGEGELATKVKLLIIDEVHLLHEERGAVIETIVARTLRLVESSQSLIRIVGLSATLPNYVDVADFLRVNRYQGLFFFDSSFRPVPLEQHFLGVKGKANAPATRQKMDKATFAKLQDLVEQGHQVMIFVHARKETVKTAYAMRDMCREEGLRDVVLEARDQGNPDAFRREIMESRNRELKELFETGFGIHHAGMLRKDRNLSERLFEAGVTRVLCCTSTLAWGVNLPAYAVLIKGTDVYDSTMGKFSDLSILDVLQIFGRAGRPQYEKVGVGYIVTSHDKLSHYVDAITSQHPIESHFKTGMIDALNAECSLGSVNSISDGIKWLSYTYLFTRMRRNPLQYGMLADEVADDPQLGAKRLHEITSAARYLAQCKMLEVDESSGQLSITELGRIAARYYITYKTIEVFNDKLRNNMTEADLLSVFGQATDFEQILPRETEIQELKKLRIKVPCEISGALETSAGKTNLLLQAFISRLYIDDFALVSDSAYVAQNAGRVMRALFEIALSKRWAATATAALGLTRSIERRLWPFDHPLAQCRNLRSDMIHQVSRWADEKEIHELVSMPINDLATLCRVNARHAEAIRDAAKRFPSLLLECKLKPLTFDLLRVDCLITRDYEWKSSDMNTGVDAFYVWIEDEGGNEVVQSKRITFHGQTVQHISFVIDHLVLASSSSGIAIRWISESWLGAEDVVEIPFNDLRMADPPQPSTELLDLQLLHTADCCQSSMGPAGEALVKDVKTLNALQTQVFSAFTDSTINTICAMPHRAGRTLLVNMALFCAVQRVNGIGLMLVLHPTLALAYQAMLTFKQLAVGIPVQLVTDLKRMKDKALNSLCVVFSTPSVIEGALNDRPLDSTKSWLSSLHTIVLEDIHVLSVQNELAISVLRKATLMMDTRWIATSVSLENCGSLQAWLDVPAEGLFNFAAKDRPSALRTTVTAFDLAHSLHLLKAMIKPAYDRITQSIGMFERAMVFVPSRAQTIGVAQDLVRHAASEMNVAAFTAATMNGDLQPYLTSLHDKTLGELLLAGVGVFNDSMSARDRRMTLALYASRAIRVLVVSRDACWSLPPDVYCRCIVIMGTQFMRLDEAQVQMDTMFGNHDHVAGKRGRSRHARLVDYPMSDVMRMQSYAAAPQPISMEDGNDATSDLGPNECHILCQGDQAMFLRRMVDSGILFESKLLDEDLSNRSTFYHFVLCQVGTGCVKSQTDLSGLLEWTLARRRMRENPFYYEVSTVADGGLEALNVDPDVRLRLEQAATNTLEALRSLQCVELTNVKNVCLTQLGASIVKHQQAGLNLVLRLLTLEQHYERQPDEVAQALLALPSVRTFKPRVSEHGEDVLHRVLDATRLCTSGELLARFNVPRISRKAVLNGKSVEEQQQQQDEENPSLSSTTTTKTTANGVLPLTEVQIKALLLALFFSKSEYRIRTPSEAQEIKAKGLAGKSDNVDKDGVAAKKVQVLLQKCMLSLVQTVLAPESAKWGT